MTEAPDALTALAIPVAEAMPVIAARIPAGPAAELGRLGVPRGPQPAGRARAGLFPMPRPGAALPEGSPVYGALRELGQLLVERLLGALELTVPGLGLAGAWELPPSLSGPRTGSFVHGGILHQESTATIALALLDQLRPGVADLALSLTRQLADHPLIEPLLAAGPSAAAGPGAAGAADEASIAAAHGRGYLALAVAVARAIVGQVRLPPLPWMDAADDATAAVVGVAVGVAVLVVRATPMPGSYAAALLEKARAEYLLPVQASAPITVGDHRFALAEGEFPEADDFSGNGLLAVVPGGAVIRAGREEGDVEVMLTVVADEPPLEDAGWDEVIEVSWRAAVGQAMLTGPAGLDEEPFRDARHGAPPWPGDYRLRVHAAGRDDPDDDERYELIIWQAPVAPEIVHKRTDQLGHRLRGEPEPARPDRPGNAYRWIDDTLLGMGATITVVTGATAAAVLRAFGADPAQPESLREIDEEVTESMSLDPWVAVLDVGPAVLAVEYNGWHGTDESVLARASAGGRAASMYWSGGNGATRRSFAKDGRLLASFEWLRDLEDDVDSSVVIALAGLEFDGSGHWVGTGLVAVERFTGYRVTVEDVQRIEAADIAFRIAVEP